MPPRGVRRLEKWLWVGVNECLLDAFHLGNDGRISGSKMREHEPQSRVTEGTNIPPNELGCKGMRPIDRRGDPCGDQIQGTEPNSSISLGFSGRDGRISQWKRTSLSPANEILDQCHSHG